MSEFTPHCYTIDFLRDLLAAYEERYGVSSADFYDAWVLRSESSEVHFFDRTVWIDSYEEYVRLTAQPKPVAVSRPPAIQPVG
jgi:hypothetical protein